MARASRKIVVEQPSDEQQPSGDQPAEVFRVKEAFAVATEDGFPRAYQAGALISGDDALAATHRHLLEPAASRVEKATAEPGERRRLTLPSGVRQAQAIAHHKPSGATAVTHSLPPTDPNSPASPFAPDQPGAGIVADDVTPEQNLAGGTLAAEAAPSIEVADAVPTGETPEGDPA